MKIKPFILITSILALFLISAIIITNWNKHLIYLSNGEIIEADKTWVVFDEVFYEKGEGTLYTVKTNAVDEILSASFSSFYDWKVILVHAMESKQGVFEILMDRTTGFICLAIFCFYGAVTLVHFILSKKARKKEKADDDELITIHIPPQASDYEKIVLFFMNLYLLQVKAKKNDRYHYRRTDIRGPLNTTVYEFRVLIGGLWQSRRISIGRIGEDSGARSKCFYVIYDDHFVVKLPPEPLTDINEYTKSIKSDRRIADILAPRECLVPKVSIVLKKIPSFINAIDGNAGANEQKCIDGLKKLPEFRRFLKIGENFAFYLDLSKHFFLGQILNECHDASSEIAKEKYKYQDMIWTPQVFADRYGEDSTELCVKLQNVYEQFDKQFNDPAVPSFQKKAWFTGSFLVGEDVGISSKIPGNALTIINILKKDKKAIVDEYKVLLKNYVQVKFFKQNISKVQCICSRLIELLSWLYLKNIAIRDLKPDNLLVAGDPSKYPHFLNSVDGFEIGLIDVEIAAYMDPENNKFENKKPENKKVVQPKLGWTPFYATPSHMFVNEVLEQLYDDMIYIFFLQDWYATVAMIYQSVTGEKLFVKTADTLVSYSRELSRYFSDLSKMIFFAKKANEKFWKDADNEFELKMKEKETLLRSVHLEISRSAKKMFKKAAENTEQVNIQKTLFDMKSHISAYDLLECLFAHIEEVMTRN
ncbi:MAG: hypothetical protein HF978_20360 [Desulfobacteraceae bacterium]|nr:hypothetical protein [Desulfobacteraceae bacterium]MBC2757902.1 hypothetical protein [Desulfobacteraceae bacterium]